MHSSTCSSCENGAMNNTTNVSTTHVQKEAENFSRLHCAVNLNKLIPKNQKDHQIIKECLFVLKLAFLKGRDSPTFRNKGTEVTSLSRDKLKILPRDGTGWDSQNPGRAGTAKNRDGTRDKTGQSRKGRSKTEKGCSKTEKDVLKQERML